MLDNYQKGNNLSTRTEAMRNMIKSFHMIRRDQPNTALTPQTQSTTQTEREPGPQEEKKKAATWETPLETKIKCPETQRPGDFWRCERRCGKRLQVLKNCEAISEEWKRSILEDIEAEQKQNREQKQDQEEELGPEKQEPSPYDNDVKEEGSELEEQNQTPQKPEIRKLCCINLLRGEVTQSDCEKCDEDENRKITVCYPKMWPKTI